ncbi:ABC transporter permease [Roseivirga sp.]|uniref:ABC transporter permease n=1 Tax=Roseivirga sp. TaxID=1964215 RepID=UPI003B8E8984
MLKKVGQKLISFYCHPDFQEDIIGDLEEYYEAHSKSKGVRYANRKFFLDALLLFRLSLLKDKWFSQQLINTPMVRNIFKTAFRVFWKEKGYASLNILGLTIGITASMLLLLFVESERSVNQFHSDIDNIYQVMEHQTYSNYSYTYESNPGPLSDYFKQDMAEVEYMAAFTWMEERLFRINGQSFKEQGRVASEDFFQIFDVKFIEGSKEESLTDPTKLYLSRSTKERIFGDQPALSKTLQVDGWGDYQVAGVFEDIPKESTINFDFVMPYAPWKARNGWLDNWGNNGIRGIAKLQPGVDVEAFNTKILNYVNDKQDGEESVVTLFLQPFGDRYLYNNYDDGKLAGGRIAYVKLFTVVAIFILMIAAINFMNLATARSTKRAKEVGIKKVVGSSKFYLLLQFMSESIILATFSTIVAGFLIMLILPPLNTLVDKAMTFSFTELNQVGLLLGIGVGVGFLSGLYPSFVLSGFKALSVLKGTFKTSGWSNGLRKGLVVFQFIISTVLIISTLVIHDQMSFIKNKNLGYNKDNVVYFGVEGELEDLNTRELLKQRILENPNFVEATFSNGSPLSVGSSTSGGFSWEGKIDQNQTNFYIIRAGHDFVETYGLDIIQGRSFDKALATDTMNVIINEQTAKMMNVDDPMGVPITFWNRTGRVVGIVKDFHFSSLHEGIEPLIIGLRPEDSQVFSVKMTGQNVKENLAYLEKTVKEINPNYPFEYRFVDESFEQLYKSESTIGILADYFSVIAIFISLLGLFGLASFAAEQRIKEIGVRKVLGASIINLLVLMTKGFMILVGVGFIIAAPIGYYFMDNWLNAFEYRVDIGPSVFLLAGLASLVITVLTVSYHSLKAVHANPAKSLKYE